MTIQESINRSYNLLATSIVGLAGLAFLPEVIFENDLPDKVDDALLFVLGAAAAWWYTRSRNRCVRSALPLVLVVLALAVKILGVIIEHSDPESLGDDMGGLILFICGTILMLRQWYTTKKLLSEN